MSLVLNLQASGHCTASGGGPLGQLSPGFSPAWMLSLLHEPLPPYLPAGHVVVVISITPRNPSLSVLEDESRE